MQNKTVVIRNTDLVENTNLSIWFFEAIYHLRLEKPSAF